MILVPFYTLWRFKGCPGGRGARRRRFRLVSSESCHEYHLVRSVRAHSRPRAENFLRLLHYLVNRTLTIAMTSLPAHCKPKTLNLNTAAITAAVSEIAIIRSPLVPLAAQACQQP